MKDRRTLELPGTGPDYGGLARLLAAAPLKAKKDLLPCDIGLFSDDANALDLLELARKEPRK